MALTESIPDEPNTSYWQADPLLRSWLEKRLPAASFDFARPRLEQLGSDAAQKVSAWAATADRESPRLVDGRIEYHPSYREMEKVAYGSGMIALKYDPAVRAQHPGQVQKIGFSLGYLFGQAELGLYCPVCMTDGVARVLAQSGDQALADQWIPRLCFTDLANRTTGAMFLTERQGGSDVGASVVRADRDGSGWRLSGEKWFCSNADAELALVLARPDDAPTGTRGLGLFLLPRDLEGKPQSGLQITKLKDKLGVRSMPTGEIELDRVLAWQVGPLDRGFKQMAEMVNYSRLYNSLAAVAVLARARYEAEDWAARRMAFGRRVIDHPLVRETIDFLRTEHAAAFVLAFEAVDAVDRLDGGDESALGLFRMLTPMAKFHTGKAAVAGCSEAMEVVGGNGYIEDRVMPRLLRDAQVLPIWEGTTNIQIHDAVRAVRVSKGGEALVARLQQALEQSRSSSRDRLAARIKEMSRDLAAVAGSRAEPGVGARAFWSRTSRTVQATLLAELGADDHAAALIDGRTFVP